MKLIFADSRDIDGTMFVADDDDNRIIAHLDFEGRRLTDEESIKMGTMFAASPDLIAVCKEFVADCDALGDEVIATEWPDLIPTLKAARAAIAKATPKAGGES